MECCSVVNSDFSVNKRNIKGDFLWIFGQRLKSKTLFYRGFKWEKRRENILFFDQMLRVRKSISFSKVNSDCRKKGR